MLVRRLIRLMTVLVLVSGLLAAPAQAALSWCGGGCGCRTPGGSDLALKGKCHCCPERPAPGALQPWSRSGPWVAVLPDATRPLISASPWPAANGLDTPPFRPFSTALARPGPAVSRWGPRHVAHQTWRC
ncbi:MAG: hypothetical protein KJ621_18030 [Proteobacteria bacterium]|nr:hypothetical protein [Pseudomonadota bacterium]MBU1743158.1 hypothetical protein [Pseudomonadota bacterium]